MKKTNIYGIRTINFTSSNITEDPQPPRKRKLNARLIELLDSLNESSPGVTRRVERADVSSSSSQQDEPMMDFAGTSVPVSEVIDQARSHGTQALENNPTSFYSWLTTTLVVDDLSFREPFISSARDANQLTEQELLLQAVELYRNAEQLRPEELVNLPFVPLPMRTGRTMSDIPFLDPLLVVLGDIHIEDLHWMLNVLPWRVVDRPIRSGCSILAWILKIGSIHTFLETTRAPLGVTVKIIRFVDNFFE